MTEILSKDDYEEPRCLLNMHPEVTPIPIGRIMEKLDSYLNKKDYDVLLDYDNDGFVTTITIK